MARSTALPSARAAALAVLRGCLRNGEDVQPALDHAVASFRLSARDAALATELCYGVLRLKGRLDALLDRFLKAPGKVPPKLRDALEVAAYEIHFLDKVPEYAAVDWAVSYVRAEFGKALSGLANAVLRNVARLGDAAHDPETFRAGARDEAAFLARWHSCPEWVVRMWRAQMPSDRVSALLEAQSLPAPLGLRLNPVSAESGPLTEELAARPGLLWREGDALAFAPGSIPPGEIDELLRAGALSRQSAAAQQALLALAPASWPGPVWDACAGRGGKSLILAERGLAPRLASDPNARRLRGLSRECHRLGLPEIPAVRARAEEPPLRRWEGTILLDAPCSGLGVLARRPDSKWKRTPRDCGDLAALQRRILTASYDLLAPGGAVAYLTCTLNRDENEGAVDHLLRERPDARLETTWATPADSILREFFFTALIRKP
ncbi:Fmu (Sun) domain protein [Desulfovibrio sp. X2]|uniref:transcription antitermination factor NusB n=1 Tax=Desulfovibrio sp. X2 TaxID=941449 RepID=UPI00035876C3|nr:transcription antitermination factor NusB [Desulfovibrio sp. X2]EPR44005.1 Fmu (Sun) domain protein [Desulfovibrio sp. X2]